MLVLMGTSVSNSMPKGAVGTINSGMDSGVGLVSIILSVSAPKVMAKLGIPELNP